MITRSSIKNVLPASLFLVMSFLSSTAGAIVYPVTTTSTSCTLALRAAGKCSLAVEGILRGLGNTSNNPTAFSATILIRGGFIVFTNPAGKSGTAQGTPFANLEVALQASDLIDANQIDRNGRAISTLEYHEDALIDAIRAGLAAGCTAGNELNCQQQAAIEAQIAQHPNWIRWAVVTKLEVLGQQFVQSLPNCDINAALASGDFSGCIPPEDALGNKCDAPQTVLNNPIQFAGKAFNYNCVEACHNKTGPTCPTSLPLP